MANRFDYCLDYILDKEGGCCDVKGDRGGRTAYGITQERFTDYSIRCGLPMTDVWSISKQQVRDIYFDEYWLKCKCTQTPEPMDILMFDSAVQHGPVRAIRWMQGALGVAADGVIGIHTVNALQEEAAANTIKNLCVEYLRTRGDFYRQIIERDATQKKFEKGWANRLLAISKEVGAVV